MCLNNTRTGRSRTGFFPKRRNCSIEGAFSVKEESAMNIPDELVRQRSYEIWQREGCPHGLSAQHWFQAKAELEGQYRAERVTAIESEYRQKISPRPAISQPPRKLVALKLRELDRSRAA
jgi:hypothetical protein